MLEDSRLIRRYNDLQHGLKAEMEFLANLRDETWQVIAGTCGLSALELRTEVLGAAHRSISFMDFRFFSVVRARPWSLASGDVDQQLDALSSEEEEPSDPISAKVWKLLRSLHYNREKLRQAINFFGEITWNTSISEQQHASGTLIGKYHPEVGQSALTIRALLHTMRHLLPELSESELSELRLKRCVARLERRQPQKATARQMMCQELVHISSRWKRDGRANTEAMIQQRVFRNHGPIWSACPADKKRLYEKKAAVHQAMEHRRVQGKYEEVVGALELLQVRKDDERRHCGSLSLKSCKWTTDDLHRLDSLYRQGSFSRIRVDDLRTVTLQAPPPPSADVIDELSAFPVYKTACDKPMPHWVKQVAIHREVFTNCIFIFWVDGFPQCFKFMFAQQNPMHLQLSPLKYRDVPLQMESVISYNWQTMAARSWRNTFEPDYMKHVAWHELPSVPLDAISILRPAVYLRGGDVASDGVATPLAALLEQLPAVTISQKQGSDSSASSRIHLPQNAFAELVAQHPWLAGSLEQDAKVVLQKMKTSNSDHVDVAEREDVGLTDDQIEEAFGNLRKARDEWGGEDPDSPDWRITVVGGAWTAAKRGSAFDGFRAAPRPGSAEEFAIRYQLGRSAYFATSIYGVAGASDMARAFAHKCQWFHDIWQASPEHNYIFTAADLAGYQEPDSVKLLAETMPLRVKARIQWLRHLMPSSA